MTKGPDMNLTNILGTRCETPETLLAQAAAKRAELAKLQAAEDGVRASAELAKREAAEAEKRRRAEEVARKKAELDAEYARRARAADRLRLESEARKLEFEAKRLKAEAERERVEREVEERAKLRDYVKRGIEFRNVGGAPGSGFSRLF